MICPKIICPKIKSPKIKSKNKKSKNDMPQNDMSKVKVQKKQTTLRKKVTQKFFQVQHSPRFQISDRQPYGNQPLEEKKKLQ